VHKPFRLAIAATAVLCAATAAHAQQPISLADAGRSAAAQQNVPPAAQRVQNDAERVARRYGFGVSAGVGLDPEIVDVGAHATFGPIFNNLQFRPGIEIGIGELTTLFNINLDGLYTFDNDSRRTAWLPYVGAGASFGLSHQGFSSEDLSHLNIQGLPDSVVQGNSRFDFGDTDFNGGMNFIVGMRKQRGAFFEMRATAWGVSSIRLLGGYNF
jgi:hypothetical protein